MPLTNLQITNAKSHDKSYKMADGGGLYLLVHTNGSKYWRLKYRYMGKEKTMSFGTYPQVNLADVRELRRKAKDLLAAGIDPNEEKKSLQAEAELQAANTFELIAHEWHEKQSNKWTPKTAARTLSLLKRFIFPYIGNKPILALKAPLLLHTIQRIEKRGNIETAHRALQNCGQIFRYAIATGRATTDLSLALKGSLTPVNEKHHASITDPNQISDLLKNLQIYEGSFITKCALKLAPLLFVRPGELRSAEWAEINFENSEWKIPATKMKMKSPHIVPLSKQAKEVLLDLKQHTGHGKYVFPGVRSKDRPMSENTVNAALRRLGYEKEDMTGHGFRSMASTILHEQGWPHDAIERQLAHAERNKVTAAYNYADYLPKRKQMMQSWADYLEELTIEAI